AERAGAASRIVVMGGGLYRLAFVPVRAPAPIAWLCAGFALDARSADDLRRLTGLHVSFVRRAESGFVVHASTLEGAARAALRRGVVGTWRDEVIQLGGHPHAMHDEPSGA